VGPSPDSLLQERLSASESLRDSVRLFLLRDPLYAPSLEVSEPASASDDPYEEELFLISLPPPVVLALPAALLPAAATGSGEAAPLPLFAWSALSVFTTAGAALGAPSSAVAPPLAAAESAAAAGSGNMVELLDAAAYAAPIYATVAALLLAHDAAHAMAARRHSLPVKPPLLLPSVELGTFGTHALLGAYPPSRSALADFALSGPLVGTALSAAAFVAGLALTAAAPAPLLDSFPRLSPAILHSSLLPSLLVDGLRLYQHALPDAAASPVPLHPLAIGGFLSLLGNALSLVPCGRLDGGRAATACFGRRASEAMGVLSVLVVLSAVALNDGAPELLLLWGGVVLLPQLLQQGEVPCADEITPPPESRRRAFLALVVVAILCLSPAPHTEPALSLDSFAESFGAGIAL